MPLPHPALPFSFWSRSLQQLQQWLPGLLLCSAIAAVSMAAAALPALHTRGLSALTLAIVLGLVLGNTLYPRWSAACASGTGLSKTRLLRTGIVLYGLRLTFQDMAQLGWAGLAIDAVVLSSTFVLAQWLGQRVLGLDARTAMLVGAGSAICGAAAVLATEPVAKGRAQDVAVAVATVVVFGTVAMFVYPALFHWNAAHGWLAVSPQQYGLWVGSTVHEVAQVVAAGEAVGREAADMAVTAKMARVMMLAPFLLALSWWMARSERQATPSQQHASASSASHATGAAAKLTIPWFALGFVAVAGIHSLGVLPAPLVQLGVQLDTLLLTVAMAALGLTTHLSAVRAAGTKPLLLALALFAWLLGIGLLLNVGLPHWL